MHIEPSSSTIFPSDLAEIVKMVSLEYEEELTSLMFGSHHWVIVKDEITGVIGGLCLTPSFAKPRHPLLARFCKSFRDRQVWVASHLFCWLPIHLDESKGHKVEKYVAAFFTKLYKELVNFSAGIGIDHVWFLSHMHQFPSIAQLGLFPFSRVLPFTHEKENYTAALLLTDHTSATAFDSSHHFYSGCDYRRC